MTQEQERKILKINWYLILSLWIIATVYLLIKNPNFFNWSEIGSFTKIQIVILILQITLLISAIKKYGLKNLKMNDQPIDKLRINIAIGFVATAILFLLLYLL